MVGCALELRVHDSPSIVAPSPSPVGRMLPEYRKMKYTGLRRRELHRRQGRACGSSRSASGSATNSHPNLLFTLCPPPRVGEIFSQHRRRHLRADFAEGFGASATMSTKGERARVQGDPVSRE
jgi:hypothetical protein